MRELGNTAAMAPVQLRSFTVFTNVMSLDAGANPAHLRLVSGKPLHQNSDLRWQSGFVSRRPPLPWPLCWPRNYNHSR